MSDKAFDQPLPLDPELAKRNAESWQAMVSFYERFVAMPSWEWLAPCLQLVRRIADTKQATLFRAGQSLYHLLISTKEKRGLEEGDPFIAVRLERNQPFHIQYSDTTGRIVQSQICTIEDDVLSFLEPLLMQLWNGTRGKDNPPDVSQE